MTGERDDGSGQAKEDRKDRVLTQQEWIDSYLEWAWDLTRWAIENRHI